jgi:hypothetical protein
MIVMNVFALQPCNEMGKVVRDLFADENPVYHMAAKQPHLYFVAEVWVDFFIFMDAFENMRSGGPI